MRRCTRGGTLIVVAVGISLALVAGAFGGQSGKIGGKMATVVQKEQILSGELGVPNFPEKVGAWHLASDWKTEGQAGGEWSHRVTVTYAHEQDSEKQVRLTLTLYRSVEGARKALAEALEGIKQHNQSESVKGVGVQMLTLYGVAQREVKSAGLYYVVYKAGTGDAYMGESFGLPLPGSIPTGAFWAWKNVFLDAGDGVLAPGLPMSLEEADSFISSLLADVAKRWVKPRQTRGKTPDATWNPHHRASAAVGLKALRSATTRPGPGASAPGPCDFHPRAMSPLSQLDYYFHLR